jgi:hypothetical protein
MASAGGRHASPSRGPARRAPVPPLPRGGVRARWIRDLARARHTPRSPPGSNPASTPRSAKPGSAKAVGSAATSSCGAPGISPPPGVVCAGIRGLVEELLGDRRADDVAGDAAEERAHDQPAQPDAAAQADPAERALQRAGPAQLGARGQPRERPRVVRMAPSTSSTRATVDRWQRGDICASRSRAALRQRGRRSAGSCATTVRRPRPLGRRRTRSRGHRPSAGDPPPIAAATR